MSFKQRVLPSIVADESASDRRRPKLSVASSVSMLKISL